MPPLPLIRFIPLPLDVLNAPDCDPKYIENFIQRRLQAFEALAHAAYDYYRAGIPFEGGKDPS